MKLTCFWIISSFICVQIASYSIIQVSKCHAIIGKSSFYLKASKDDVRMIPRPPEASRDLLTSSSRALRVLLMLPTIFLSREPILASNGPVVVLGSGGKTGKIIVDLLSKKPQVNVVPVYRSVPKNSVYSNSAIADVTDIQSLENVLKGASVVIFAASASKDGGSAEKVDYFGLKNVAEEVVRLKVPRLVVISSAAITKPASLGYKFTNIFGGIMDYKLKGELALQEIFQLSSTSNYVIIRPGGLTDRPAVGPMKIELNQGDTIAGEVSRADVAAAAVEAGLTSSIPKNVVFEMYEAGTGAPLEGRFPDKSGYERRGPDYEALFAGLQSGINGLNK